MNFSNSSNQVLKEGDSSALQSKKISTSAYLSNSDSSTVRVAKMMSSGSMASQSSTGSSTLSTIQGLKEINKVILSNNMNPRKELLSSRDNKVYSYKLNQLISIIKSSQTNAIKKQQKKKSVVTTKITAVSSTKKVCRKVNKTNRKLPKNYSSKSSVTSKPSHVI